MQYPLANGIVISLCSFFTYTVLGMSQTVFVSGTYYHSDDLPNIIGNTKYLYIITHNFFYRFRKHT